MGSSFREESAGQIIRTWGGMQREQIMPQERGTPEFVSRNILLDSKGKIVPINATNV